MTRLMSSARLLRRRLMYAFSRRSIVTHSFLGEPLRVTIADPTARDWYARQLPTASEMLKARDHGLHEGALVFDLGAHQAVIALMLSRIVGPAGRVIAVEPDPHSYRIANSNRILNEASNMTVIHAAASDTAGTSLFGLGFGSSGSVALAVAGGHPQVEVPCVTVDDLVAEYGFPDVVYVDVEGFEQRVLMGATQTLRRRSTTWVVEVHVGCGLEASGGSAAEVLAYFPSGEYDVYVKHPDPHRRDELIPLSELGRELDYHCNIVAAPRVIPQQ